MIEWLPFDRLGDRLRSYPPIGLIPRAFYSAIVDDDPRGVVRRASGGVSEACWSGALCGGLVNTMPFVIYARQQWSWLGGGFVLEVWFPTRADNDLAALHALALLPLPAPRPLKIRFEPLCGGPFGVAQIGSREPIYIPRSRAEAVVAARLLNGWFPKTFAVIPAPPTEPPWLVVGPRSGPYISNVLAVENEAQARSVAERESCSGFPHTVERSLPEWVARTL